MAKIIGHRGAAGLGLENSHESLRAALNYNVHAIEFDVRLTKDNALVVMHDAHTGRIARENLVVRQYTLKQLQNLQLHGGHVIPTLEEFLHIAGSAPIIIEIKDSGTAAILARILNQYSEANARIASFHHSELAHFKKLRPDIVQYVLQRRRPFDIVRNAKRLGAHGFGINKWVMNPLTYWLAKKNGLEVYVYTVNGKILGRLYKQLYPGIALCTDYPHRFTTFKGQK